MDDYGKKENILISFIEPSSIRLITDKVTKKPKGFAFVEFTGSKYLEVSIHINSAQYSNIYLFRLLWLKISKSLKVVKLMSS